MSNCLQLDHVDYAYGAAKILVLSDVSADFESGKMYAITGEPHPDCWTGVIQIR